MSPTKFDDPVTNALYQSIVGSVRKIAAKSDFSVEDMPDLFGRLKKESETAQVLIFSAWLEDKIRYLIRSHLLEINSEGDENDIFNPNGPLGGLSSRILIMKHLGWISPASANNLNRWRKIRNEFAHRAYKTSFEDQKIKDLWSQIAADPSSVFKALAGSNFGTRELEALPDAEQRLTKLVMFATGVFEELLLGPIARSWAVAPGDVVAGKWEDLPGPAKQLWENSSGAIVRIAQEET